MASILNQRSVDIRIRSGLDFSKASWWFHGLSYCTCLWTETNLEAFGKASALTCETSQCYRLSRLYDASSRWCDHSGALYC